MTTNSPNENWYGPAKGERIMHPDLEWLARNVSEWPKKPKALSHGIGWNGSNSDGREPDYIRRVDPLSGEFKKSEWLKARRDLGLEPSGISDADEEECIQLAYERMSKKDDPYSAYFKDVRHIETLDVYRVIDLFGCEKHGHPISHAVKKLLLSGARTGGKDVEADVREAIDSATRWLEMQEENRRAL